jgi:transposase InsO family protein
MPRTRRLSWDQKLCLVQALKAGTVSVTELCRGWQLSRQTAYKWLRREGVGGPMALREQSRAPHHRPHALTPLWLERIEQLRRRLPRWGPKKLRALLHRKHPRSALPSASTIGAVLQRLGLVVRRRRRQLGPVILARRVRPVRHPNEVWTVDFKGWFATLNGQRCDPLTVRDLASRYGLLAKIMPHQRFLATQQAFQGLFQQRGQPHALRMDNGSPFGSTGPAGLSRLSAWWITLGIEVQFNRPGHPEDNGAHEQWHRELKAAIARPPAANHPQQARRTGRWLRHYNEERPHEALQQQPPTSIYRASRRRWRGPQPPRYPAHRQVRRVRSNGQIKWQGRFRFVGEAFTGHLVALRRLRKDQWRVYFYHVLLGELHETDTTGLRPAQHRRHGTGPRKV